MTKKYVLMVVLLGMILGSVFAQSEFSFSVGAGGYFTNDFGGGFETSSPFSRTITHYTGGGASVFFDAVFAELTVGMLSVKETIDNGVSPLELFPYGMDFGLFGKFPFHLGSMFDLFPLLGVEYRLVLSAPENSGKQWQSGYSPVDLSALWIKAGAGLDFSINEALYLRGEALYGIRFANKYENDDSGKTPLLGHGFTIKLALGYRFN